MTDARAKSTVGADRPSVAASPGEALRCIAFEQLVVPVCVVDAQERIVEVNGAVLQLLGYSRDELLHRRVRDVAGGAAESPLEGRRTNQGSGAACRLQRKDGTFVRVVALSGVVVDDRGAPLGTATALIALDRPGLFHDSLSEAVARLNEAQGVAHVGSWSLDLGTGRLVWSDEIFRIFEIDPGTFEASYEAFLRAVHPDDREMVDEAYKCSLRDRRPYAIEHRLLFPDGRVKFVHEECATSYQGDTAVRSTGTVQDITQRKQVEERLRASEAQMRAIFQGAQDGILLADPVSRKFLLGNAAMGRLIGCSPDALTRLSMDELHPPKMAPIAAAEVERQIRGESTSLRDVPVRRSDGSIVYCDLTSSMVDVGGQRQLVGIFRDVSERRRAAEEERTLRSQLEHANKLESLGRLAGGVAHDFNNMLQVILLHTGAALASGRLDAELRERLDEVLVCAQRSADLTRQLLAFARQGEVSPKVVDLNRLVEGALSVLRRLIGESIELVWSPAAEPQFVNVDPSQFVQVLTNLCVNARDAVASQGGSGRISIDAASVSFDEAEAARVAQLSASEYVRLSVRDNGCGIEPEVIARIFEPFFTTKVVGKGTGLGLATVYGLVRRSGGGVCVQSELGRGTELSVFLPRRPAQCSPRPREATVPAPRQATILVVEDEPSVLAVVKRALEQHSYVVLSASSPREALRVAERADSIDLLLSDIVMPEMNGVELARRLGAMRPGLRKLFVSGYTADALDDQVARGESLRLVQKPFDAGTLLRAVDDALGDG